MYAQCYLFMFTISPSLTHFNGCRCERCNYARLRTFTHQCFGAKGGFFIFYLFIILHVRIVQVSVVMCDTGRGVVMILLQGQAFGLCVSSGIVYVRMCEWVG